MMPTWGAPGETVTWCLPTVLKAESSHDVVAQVVCQDASRCHSVVTLFPCRTMARLEGELLDVKSGETLTFLKAQFLGKTDGVIRFNVTGCHVLRHPVFETGALWKSVELCSGMGCLTQGLEYAGFTTLTACDWNDLMGKMFVPGHPWSHFCCGDFSNDQTLLEIHASGSAAAMLCAGFSCQPFSQGGLQKGCLDGRSKCLYDVLKAAILLRKPVLCLECVSEAASNAWVRQVIHGFAKQCHYLVSEIVLRMEQVWPCRRRRWWVVLTVSELGRVDLVDYPEIPHPTKVKHVLPEPLPMTVHELDQLRLSPDEYKRLLQFGDPSRMLLDLDGLCPTFVHSCGSQLLACPCMCRGPFADETLQKKGVFGILIPIQDVIWVDDEPKPGFRHPHPWEVALLSGCRLPWDLSSAPLRLWLSGLGQMASPLHSVWISAQIRKHLEVRIGGFEPCDPIQILTDYLQDCQDMCCSVYEWKRESSVPNRISVDLPVGETHDSGVAMQVEDVPVQFGNDVVPVSDHCIDANNETPTPWISHPTGLLHQGGPLSFTLVEGMGSSLIIPLASARLSVGDFVKAECNMVQLKGVVKVFDLIHEKFLLDDDCIEGRVVSIVQDDDLPSRDSGSEDTVPATVPYVIQEEKLLDPLASLSVHQLVSLDCPTVFGLAQLFSLTNQSMDFQARLQILSRQEFAMADDELRFHVYGLLTEVGNTWTFLDPLLANRLLATSHVDLVRQWFSTVGFVPLQVATVLDIGGHWIPVLLHACDGVLEILTWSSIEACSEVLDHVVHSFRLAWDCKSTVFHGLLQPCVTDTLCGISSVLFLRHVLLHEIFPHTFEELRCAHEVARRAFADSISSRGSAFRPWVWALGLDSAAYTRLSQLLVQHGVPESQVAARIGLATQALGLVQLQKTLLTGQPWRNLKSLANQQRPPFQWVLKEELADVVDQRTKGAAKKAKKGDAKKSNKLIFSKPVLPSAIDPSKLVLETGLFVTKAGRPLNQIPPEQLGPFSEGIALATSQTVDQFLKSTGPITDLPIGVVLVDLTEPPGGLSLPWTSVRVAVRCAANGEPVLLSGILVQLGREEIGKAVPQVLESLPTAEVACTKIAAYRDSIDCPGTEFVRSPIKYIFQKVPCLDVCENTNCTCGKWHRSATDASKSPVFDIWRKQWVTGNFKPTSPEKAEVFLVNVRHLESWSLFLPQLVTMASLWNPGPLMLKRPPPSTRLFGFPVPALMRPFTLQGATLTFLELPGWARVMGFGLKLTKQLLSVPGFDLTMCFLRLANVSNSKWAHSHTDWIEPASFSCARP